MSASLVVFVPLALFAIVPLLCFVGCSFRPRAGISPYGQFNKTVTTTAGLVAYWPLFETSGMTAFDDSVNQFNGTYTQGQNVPYDPANQSAAASGAITLDQPGIVAGDKDTASNQNPCILVDGGYVSVPFEAALNSVPPFTLEAWVVANWTANDVQSFPAFRTVVESAVPTAAQGFDLFATPDNFWAAAVGIGSGIVIARPPAGSNQTIMLNSLYFLVVTYDGTTLKLWVNPADTTAGPYAQAAASGFVPAPSPTPFYIGTGRPDLPTPLNPFNGNIQDVAFYNVVLPDTTIEQHYANGNGIMMT